MKKMEYPYEVSAGKTLYKVSSGQRQTDMPIYIGIGRYIGFTDNRKAYRYRLSVSADKKAHIGAVALQI